MEAQTRGEKALGGGPSPPGEVRRINVVYFLSRGGRTDHPHLFRVNHASRAGVRLRDVKRWLSELRGKDMPDGFSWSYKRKYKGGYVWQDLKDDDLITPISDSEYVLKGCDVRATPPPCVQAPKTTRSSSPAPAAAPLEGKGYKKELEVTPPPPCSNDNDSDDRSRPVVVVLTPGSDATSPKPPPPADQDSPAGGGHPARRSAAVSPFKTEKAPRGGLGEQKPRQEEVVITIEVSRSSSKEEQKPQEEEEEAAVARAAEEEPRVARGPGGGRTHRAAVGRHRMRVARALHNILTCGAGDADDAALRPLARRQGRGAAEAGGGDDWPHTPTCPGMDGCGLRAGRKARARRAGKDKQQPKRDGRERDAHKPATLPRCSQCGKEFKPQELHAHMQACRGFKERMRSSTSSRPSVDGRRNSTAGGHRASRDRRCSIPGRPSSASAVFLLTES